VRNEYMHIYLVHKSTQPYKKKILGGVLQQKFMRRQAKFFFWLLPQAVNIQKKADSGFANNWSNHTTISAAR